MSGAGVEAPPPHGSPSTDPAPAAIERRAPIINDLGNALEEFALRLERLEALHAEAAGIIWDEVMSEAAGRTRSAAYRSALLHGVTTDSIAEIRSTFDAIHTAVLRPNREKFA